MLLFLKQFDRQDSLESSLNSIALPIYCIRHLIEDDHFALFRKISVGYLSQIYRMASSENNQTKISPHVNLLLRTLVNHRVQHLNDPYKKNNAPSNKMTRLFLDYHVLLKNFVNFEKHPTIYTRIQLNSIVHVLKVYWLYIAIYYLVN